ncbi:MAG: nuclear transport factor 2 family protein [Rhodospirillaceae bacterium]|nr:nuclear transport factor 2 family protein [Rhodospirillaceae bacterium]
MKSIGCMSWVVPGLLLGLSSAQAADLSAQDEWMIKAEIKQLVDTYAMARDNLDAVAYANTFTENGTLIIGGQPHSGRDVLQARVEGANQESIGMHIMSTSDITVIDENNATGIHYATVYGAIPGEDHPEGDAIDVAGFVAQGKYFDRYERTDEGWRISERRFERIYLQSQ